MSLLRVGAALFDGFFVVVWMWLERSAVDENHLGKQALAAFTWCWCLAMFCLVVQPL